MSRYSLVTTYSLSNSHIDRKQSEKAEVCYGGEIWPYFLQDFSPWATCSGFFPLFGLSTSIFTSWSSTTGMSDVGSLSAVKERSVQDGLVKKSEESVLRSFQIHDI